MKSMILVACHKPCNMYNKGIYTPIQVGKAISEYDLGIIGDDTGDNISQKNPSYCELTAQYWAWKNVDCRYGISKPFIRMNYWNDSFLNMTSYCQGLFTVGLGIRC